MILKVVDVDISYKSSIECDGYVPLVAIFSENEPMAILYWFARGGGPNILEIGIDPKGLIYSIVLVSIKSDLINTLDGTYVTPEEIEDGRPVFDVSNWPKWTELNNWGNRFVDNFNVTVRLDIGLDYITLLDLGGTIPIRFVKDDRVIFGFDRNNLLSNITVINVNSEEMRNFIPSILSY